MSVTDQTQIMRQMAQRLRDRTDDFEDACRTLDELQKTSGEPEKRSKSLMDKIMEAIYIYNEAMYIER